MEILTTLLSDSFRNCLVDIREKHNSEIAKDLILADDLIKLHNKVVQNWTLNKEEKETISNVLNEKINKVITDEVRALSIRRDVFEISFTPKGKPLVYTDCDTWSRENRQVGKPGRIIKKLLVYQYKERDIELFSNQLKSAIMNFGTFEIVEGDKITHWYNEDTYFKIAGTLGRSCMRYSECESYFKVYEDMAKMLICRTGDKLLGRAIIWEIDGKTYLDRVYTCMDYLEESFINYAKANGWYIREDQSLLNDESNQYWLGPKDNYSQSICPDLVISLYKTYDQFPYMDSFRHYDKETNTISTIYHDFEIELSNTDGTIEETTIVVCGCCGDSARYIEHEEDCPYVWSEYLECYLCDDCAVYNEWLEDYISTNTPTTTVATKLLDTFEIPDRYIRNHPSLFTEAEDGTIYLKDE